MTTSRIRLAAAVLLGAAALALVALFWPWIRAGVVEPLALVCWILLRLFVLSLDQHLYWFLLLAAAPVLLAVLLHRSLRGGPVPVASQGTARLHPVETWRTRIAEASQEIPRGRSLGWDGFVQLVVSLKALERRLPGDYLLLDALRSGEVSLPPAVHGFLFPPAPSAGRGLTGRLGRLALIPRQVFGRLSGRGRAARLRTVAQLISYLEDCLETKET